MSINLIGILKKIPVDWEMIFLSKFMIASIAERILERENIFLTHPSLLKMSNRSVSYFFMHIVYVFSVF